LKLGFMAAEAGKNKRAVWGVVLALVVVLVAACASETTPVPQPAPEATVIPAPAPATSRIATPEPTATAIPAPDPTANPTVAPTRIPTIQPTLSPTPDPRAAIKSEVAAAVSQFGQALSTADTELMASLFLPSEKTNRFSSSEPLRINGWSEVERSFKELLSLPPGSVSLVQRQGRIDLLGDDAALWTGHFILSVRPPEESRRTVEGRATALLQKVDGKWLRVHMHTSALPP
jgi:uncharacterized protein (TIGR02246 family)